MRILVIGATGYIGSHVAAALAAAGHRVVVLHRPGGRKARYDLVAGDLADPSSLIGLTGFDRTIHAGAPLGRDIDLAGVDALLAAGSPLIYTTGAAVLGPGDVDEDSSPDPHPIAQWRPEIERRVLAAGGWVIRPGMVYGDGDAPVPGLLAAKATERGSGVYIGEPGIRWPVVHIADLASLYLAVAERAVPGTVWHGISETARLDTIAATLGGGTAVSWPLSEATAELGLLADLFTRDQHVSASKTRRVLGWRPAHTSIVEDLTSVL